MPLKFNNQYFFLIVFTVLSIILNGQYRFCGSVAPISFYQFETPKLNSYPRENIIIPVVFHIVWHQTEENLSDAIIHSQLQIINEDYSGNNFDITKVPKHFQKHVGSANISFCLASSDPDGVPSSGIVRLSTDVESIGGLIEFENGRSKLKHSELGGTDAWDTDRYLNIWVSKRSDGIIGKASFPNDNNILIGEDGIELDYTVVGFKPESDEPFNLGRTLTHEIAHYLNIEHLWGKTISCFNEGDMIDDTPVQGEAYFGCITESRESCGSRDMIHNFMNFLDDDCMYYFTKDQSERMMDALFRYRYELISSGICNQELPIPEDPLKLARVKQSSFGLQINLSFLSESEYELTLYDMLGRYLWSEHQNDLGIHLINTETLQSGVYVFVMNMNDKKFVKKVFISR